MVCFEALPHFCLTNLIIVNTSSYSIFVSLNSNRGRHLVKKLNVQGELFQHGCVSSRLNYRYCSWFSSERSDYSETEITLTSERRFSVLMPCDLDEKIQYALTDALECMTSTFLTQSDSGISGRNFQGRNGHYTLTPSRPCLREG
jgi:hypothetical protein